MEKCNICGNQIDPDVCWCGDPAKNHTPHHSFIPMGCDCGRHYKGGIYLVRRQLQPITQWQCKCGGWCDVHLAHEHTGEVDGDYKALCPWCDKAIVVKLRNGKPF